MQTCPRGACPAAVSPRRRTLGEARPAAAPIGDRQQATELTQAVRRVVGSLLRSALQGGWQCLRQSCMPGPGCLCRLRHAGSPCLRTLARLVPQSCELIGLPHGLQPSSFWSERLPCSLWGTGTSRVSHVLSASLPACHALRTPADPPASHHQRGGCGGFRCVTTVAVCLHALPRLSQPSGTCAFPGGLHGSLGTLRRMRSVFLHLLHLRHTWYAWLVRPSSAGTGTLQEAPRFAWRTNAWS